MVVVVNFGNVNPWFPQNEWHHVAYVYTSHERSLSKKKLLPTDHDVSITAQPAPLAGHGAGDLSSADRSVSTATAPPPNLLVATPKTRTTRYFPSRTAAQISGSAETPSFL